MTDTDHHAPRLSAAIVAFSLLCERRHSVEATRFPFTPSLHIAASRRRYVNAELVSATEESTRKERQAGRGGSSNALECLSTIVCRFVDVDETVATSIGVLRCAYCIQLRGTRYADDMTALRRSASAYRRQRVEKDKKGVRRTWTQ